MCRKLDDIVDEQSKEAAIKEIGLLKKDLTKENLQKKFESLKRLDDDQFPQIKYFEEFILGQESDINFRQPKSINELLRYCYRVAGVVGLMVCDAVNIKDENLKFFAIDLGIAMQLVNIVRDIQEDALRGRVYIPENLIGAVSASDVLTKPDLITKVEQEKLRILNIADKYFNSANYAIKFLPKEVSMAFGLASNLYQGIGKKIIKKEQPFTNGRVYLNGAEKLFHTLKFLLKSKNNKNYQPIHNNMLHLPIKNSPSTNN
jgi:phytoene synthase